MDSPDPASTRHDHSRVTPYELFALRLSIFALILLGVQAAVPLDSETGRLIDAGDLFLCGLFFLDFVRNPAIAKSRVVVRAAAEERRAVGALPRRGDDQGQVANASVSRIG